MQTNHKLNNFDIGLEGFLTTDIVLNSFLLTVLQYFNFIQNISSQSHGLL